MTTVKCTCCGAVYHCTPIQQSPLSGLGSLGLGSLGLGSLFGNPFAAQAVQAEAAHRQGGLERALYSALFNQAAQHSVAARTDLWVVHPNEAPDVREHRRKRWAARDYHWHVSFKR